jgi:hypothetical protein
MALSPNYGWAEPDNSSLVKNGAQDIRALGDAIDTSVWNVGYGQAGKNKIINGDFGIWQRGTTLTTPAGSTYLADRWLIGYDGTAPTASVYNQQTFTLGTAPVAGYEGTYFARTTVTTKGSNTRTGLAQRVESVRTFAGQTVTFSFYAKADTTRTGAVQVIQSFGSGGSTAVTVVDSAISLTSAWQRFTTTVSITSIAGKTIGAGDYIAFIVYHNSADGSSLDLWGVQVEYGSKATPFQTATGTLQGELAACQRYYWRNSGTVSYASYALGYAGSTTVFEVPMTNPVQMRVTGTSVDFSGLGAGFYGSGPISVTALSLATNESTPLTSTLLGTCSGLTSAKVYQLINNNNTTGYVGISAEL